MAGQNTSQAKGRQKRLERLLETARITPPIQSRGLRFHLAPALRSGDLVLRTESLGVGYQDEGPRALPRARPGPAPRRMRRDHGP